MALYVHHGGAGAVPPQCQFFVSSPSSPGPKLGDYPSLRAAVKVAKDRDAICFRKSSRPYTDCGTDVGDKSLTITVETGTRGDAVIDCGGEKRFIQGKGSVDSSLSLTGLVLSHGKAAAGGLVFAQVWLGCLSE